MAPRITVSPVVMVAAVMLLMSWPLLAGAVVTPEEAIGMPGCDINCGDMKVPYPFGMGAPSCYWPGFNLTCDRTGKTPPRLLLGDGSLEVQDFNLEGHQLSVTHAGEIKTDANGSGWFGGGMRDDGPYMLSYDSELVLTGCNVRATLKDGGGAIISSCSSLCEAGHKPFNLDMDSRVPGEMLCTTIGCCQARIVFNQPLEAMPKLSYGVQLDYFGGNRTTDLERLPARVFVATNRWFKQPSVSTELLQTTPSPSREAMAVPVLLRWAVVGHGAELDSSATSEECPENAASSVCRSNHSICFKGARGYTCNCKDGYQGNPYVAGGCTDVDECKEQEEYRCYGVCTNSVGSYKCRCPAGTHGDSSVPGGCVVSGEAGRCSSSCGGVDVPYPFGIGPVGCYWPGFNLTCDHSSKPPRLFLDSEYDFLHVQEISLQNNTVRVTVDGATKLMTSMSVHNSGTYNLDRVFTGRGDRPYSLSNSNNELILVGCNVQASLFGDGNTTITSCMYFCFVNRTDTSRQVPSGGSDRYCNGIGCCQGRISMPTNNMLASWMVDIIDENYETLGKNSPRVTMLIAEEGWFDKRQVSDMLARDFQQDLSRSRSELQVPIILEWEVVQGLLRQPADAKSQDPTTTCPVEVATGLCKSKHSDCKRGSRGYLCQCSNGYDGNPYNKHGCKGDPKSLNTGIYIIMGVAIGAAVILLFFIALFISKKIKHRRAKMLKRHFFLKNRGQLLQQLVSQRADIAERMIITLEEIEKATNNFDRTRELGGGGHGMVYKGILSDLHVVAIKKPRKVVQKEIDEFINEVAILSQINHRNVVKLYGCCLETEVPLLVYEFISNGTLYEHLHVEGPRSLSLDDRLRIATETAKSLAYLHSTASIPIIHRDIKSVNILLDDTLTAKVADFGASRYIPVDRSGVTTMVQGTIGYLDPAYFYTQRLTEKSDVYSFGVILIELLTRKRPFAYISSDGEGLVAHFSALLTEGNMSQILDQQVIDEGGKEVEEVAVLAKACVQLRGEDRPTMRQVELALEGLPVSRKKMLDKVSAKEFERNGIMINHPWVGDERSSEETSRQYSMEEEYMLSSRYPR
ncbi:hypothetical protein ACQJBY_000737 [Aegilops geniculata]